MNLDNAKIRLNKSRQEWEKALEAITVLTRFDHDETIRQRMASERVMWRRLDAARHEVIQAKLESIGR
jgi:hypothetical protein